MWELKFGHMNTYMLSLKEALATKTGWSCASGEQQYLITNSLSQPPDSVAGALIAF